MSAYEANHAKVLELEVEIRELFKMSLLAFGTNRSRAVNDMLDERCHRQQTIFDRTGIEYPLTGETFEEVQANVLAYRAACAKRHHVQMGAH